jgi:hypothetical protein
MVRLQLSSRGEICKPVLLELLGADSYEERTQGLDINIAAHSLILNQTGLFTGSGFTRGWFSENALVGVYR